ncbi:MAG: carbonic anhydrase family protein [Sneathiella sp.]
MNKFIFPLILTFLVIFPLTSSLAERNWHFTDNSNVGVQRDARRIDPTCALGKNQSPVNISNSYEADTGPLKFTYNHASDKYRYTDDQLKIRFTNGNFRIEDEGYQLIEVHFHSPSEHQISGKIFPLEAHFKNIDKDGKVAFISVLFKKGRENVSLKAFLDNLPERTHRFYSGPFNYMTASKLLPSDKSYFRINGSLTSSPCSEGVLWFVMQHQVTISARQITAMEKVIKAPNNRSIQPLNFRIITQ